MQRPPTSRFFAYALILTLVGSLFSVVLPASQPSYASHENVTVNISSDDVTDTYDPGDSIAFVGTIDDVEDNEDVTIKVRDPSGSTKTTQNVEPDEDDGYFDFLYDIPNNAAEGAWSIEAEYSNDLMFSYFTVDDEADTIVIELNNEDGIYEAGDEVEILGMVDNADDAEEFVLLTILDPTNDEILDEEEVQLDGDEFDFSFDLENDAPHGRYAVIVTYDINDQEGSTLFEIEDADTGSGGGGSGGSSANGDSDSDGDLFAELDEETYEPGNSVTVSGTIEDYDDSEELQIIIEDPEGDEVESEDDVNVDEVSTDGEFEFEFDLEDNASEGDYVVIVSYANDEVELTFEVEGDGDSASGSDALTVKLNKSSYLAGETMTVTGTVEDVADPDDGEQVSIFLYTSEGQVILRAGSSKYITPSSSGSYSTTIVIPSDLEEDDSYRVRVSYLGETVEATFSITGVSSTPSDELSVETDRDEYNIGQTVEISGEVPDTLLADGEPLLVRINKPDGSPCRIDQVEIPSSGSYDYEMVLGGTCGVAGEYEVEVTYGGEDGSTTFELIGSSVSEYSLIVDGDTYPVEYEMSGGSINNMFVRPAENKLVITVNAEQAGQLTVELPREVIDAVEDGEDIAYLVTIEDESGNVSTIEIEESENTDDTRTLVIDYAAGTGRIEIAGTQVVPEFGAITAIIMAIAILGIIVATARYNNKFSMFGQ